jgi:hypothetical protein
MKTTALPKQSVEGPLPKDGADLNAERLPSQGTPTGQLKRNMENYIKNHYAGTGMQPRLKGWQAHKKATYGKREGWLYRVELVVLTGTQGTGRRDKLLLNYYVFVVNSSIVHGEPTRGGWETVKEFKILGNP